MSTKSRRKEAQDSAEMVTTTVRVPRGLLIDFQAVAKEQDRTVSAEMRRIMAARVAEAKAA